jgi:hypothetical protein
MKVTFNNCKLCLLTIALAYAYDEIKAFTIHFNFINFFTIQKMIKNSSFYGPRAELKVAFEDAPKECWFEIFTEN